MIARLMPTTLALACGLAACGGDSPGATTTDAGEMVQNTSGPYLPWAVGNSWTYRITDETKNGVMTAMKIVTVGAAEPVGGTGANAATVANKVTSTTIPGDQTTVWQAPIGDMSVRYRDQSATATGEVSEENTWSPYRVYFDGSADHVKRGASWPVSFEETKTKTGKTPVTSTQLERWTVVATDEVVSVPAGAFRALVVQKTGGASVKTYWYVRGVGKVKESGGQTEELVTYGLK